MAHNLICCVVNTGDASRVFKFAEKYKVKGGTVLTGRGSTTNRLLEFLGLNEVRKEIVGMIVDRESAGEALEHIGRNMEFEKPNHGIAFSYSLSEFIDGDNASGNVSESSERGKGMYQIIFVIVDRDQAEEVVEVAAGAGARGGTIVDVKSAAIHETHNFFPWKSGSDKEEVFIITKKEFTPKIVEAIRTHLKIDETGNGIIFVLEIDEVYGLRE